MAEIIVVIPTKAGIYVAASSRTFRAQQTALKVRRLYRDMDRELGVPPKDLFEKGLWSIPDSPAKFKMQCDALAVLKAQLQRRDFQAMGPALRQLYGDALEPGYERAQLISIDCQRLMDPQGEPSVTKTSHCSCAWWSARWKTRWTATNWSWTSEPGRAKRGWRSWRLRLKIGG